MRSRMVLAFSLLAAVSLCVQPPRASAAWAPQGIPLTQDSADQAYPSLISDGRGGAIVVWQEFGRIFAQRVTASGDIALEWPSATGLELCGGARTGPYGQCSPRAASDGDGGAFVLWHDDRHSGCLYGCIDERREVYLGRVTAAGKVAAGWPGNGLAVGSSPWFMSFTAGSHSPRASDFNTAMISDGSGGVIIAWEEGPTAFYSVAVTIRAQRISPTGELLWGPHGNAVSAAPGDHWYPALASDDHGGAFVIWQDHRDGKVRLMGQHLSAAGKTLWAEDGIRVTRDDSADQRSHTIVADGHGGLYLAWQTAALPQAGEEIQADAEVQSGATSGAGAAIQTGAATQADVASPVTRVSIQHLAETGAMGWDQDLAASNDPGGQSSPAAMTDRNGDLWLAWIDGAAGSADIRVQQFDKHGKIKAGWPDNGASACAEVYAVRSNPTLAPDANGGAYVAWFDGRFYPRATHLTHRGEIDSGWPAGGAHLSDSDYGDYQLRMIPDDGFGAIAIWTEGRPPRGEYSMVLAQRLSSDGVALPLRRAPGRFELDAAESTPPSTLALRGFLPNPASRSLTVSFSLPDDSPARLELFDLTGRRCGVREIAGLGPGNHLIELEATGPLPAGIYLIRLTRGDRSLVVRGAIVH